MFRFIKVLVLIPKSIIYIKYIFVCFCKNYGTGDFPPSGRNKSLLSVPFFGERISKVVLLTLKFAIGITGSTEKGKLVAAAAAKNLVPCVLELGGKCPMVIDRSADLDFAATKTSLTSFINMG